MKLILTGFGPFGLTPNNPSRIVAEKAAAHLQSHSFDVEFRPLDTSMRSVRDFYASLQPSGDIFVLHIGVDCTSSLMTVEAFAHNWGDFFRPDVCGEYLKEEAITDQYPVKHKLPNLLDVRELIATFPSDSFTISEDAGEYVCNFAYWVGLTNVGEKTRGCLFVHIPSFEWIDCDVQVDRISQLCAAIVKHPQYGS